VRSLAPDGVDLIVEVALDQNADLDFRVLKPRGTISTYASSGDGTFSLNIRQHMGLNSRLQFVLLYTLGWHLMRAAGEDINAAIADGALSVGEAAGLPVQYFSLEQTADAHRAVENNAVGKVLVRVTAEDEQR
jgi:NADPH2:quinone reductase